MQVKARKKSAAKRRKRKLESAQDQRLQLIEERMLKLERDIVLFGIRQIQDDVRHLFLRISELESHIGAGAANMHAQIEAVAVKVIAAIRAQGESVK
jgi:hypothetical protein